MNKHKQVTLTKLNSIRTQIGLLQLESEPKKALDIAYLTGVGNILIDILNQAEEESNIPSLLLTSIK